MASPAPGAAVGGDDARAATVNPVSAAAAMVSAIGANGLVVHGSPGCQPRNVPRATRTRTPGPSTNTSEHPLDIATAISAATPRLIAAM
jgi:hypothetical protein